MNKDKIVIVGASGHGKVISDIALLNGYEDIVFLDDDNNKKTCAGFQVIGKIDDVISVQTDIVVAIGDPKTRERIQSQIKTVKLVHPNSVLGSRVVIGNGTVIMAGTVINADTQVGEGCIINTCASVDHDCFLDDYVHLSPGAHICGGVKVGKRTWIGAGATICNNVRICDDCIIGAGAVVIDDIEEEGTYVGVPAKKMIKINRGGGEAP